LNWPHIKTKEAAEKWSKECKSLNKWLGDDFVVAYAKMRKVNLYVIQLHLLPHPQLAFFEVVGADASSPHRDYRAIASLGHGHFNAVALLGFPSLSETRAASPRKE